MLCWKCHYPLKGLNSRRCPECGEPFDPDKPLTYRTRRIPSFTEKCIAVIVISMFMMTALAIMFGIVAFFLSGFAPIAP